MVRLFLSVYLALLASVVVISRTDALQCRRCVGAYTSEECTAIKCGPEEQCYLDQIITDKKSVVYYGGCRRADLCNQTVSHGVGRRNIVATMCSKCCSTDNCNTKACGIKSIFTGINQCYNCHRVRDLSQCTRTVTCGSSEICSVEMEQIGTTTYFNAGCMNKQVCGILMTQEFRQLDRCNDPHDPTYLCHGIIIGKRSPVSDVTGSSASDIIRSPASDVRRSAVMCNSCCGDSLCNADTCQNIATSLYIARKHHVLDVVKLTLNGTLPNSGSG